MSKKEQEKIKLRSLLRSWHYEYMNAYEAKDEHRLAFVELQTAKLEQQLRDLESEK